MLTIYLVALVAGAALILVSLLFGGDADADVDADIDADADADFDHEFDLSGADLWLPIASVRFWIFFATFFGLAGTLLTTISDVGPSLAVTGVSALAGYICGVAASGTIRWLSSNEADSAVRTEDLVGVRATVLLPVGRERLGKVRFSLRGQVIDARAKTEDDAEYPIGSTVMVYESRDDGEVIVTSADEQ